MGTRRLTSGPLLLALPWSLSLACHGGGGSTVPPTGTDPAARCEVAIAVRGSEPGAVVAIDLASGPLADRPWSLRVVELSSDAGATLTSSTGVLWFDGNGDPVDLPLAAPAGALTLYVGGTSGGPATAEFAPPEPCDSASASLDLVVRPPPSLVGRSLPGAPNYGHAWSFATHQVVEILLDPGAFPDRIGAPFDAWVVPRRDAAAWASDPALVDVADGPVAGQVGPEPAALAVWSSELRVEPGATSTAYDLVLDFGQDGRLDPGDLWIGQDRPAFSVLRDPAEPGPYSTSQRDWSQGYWGTMRIYAPDASAPAPAPLVVISHGNGHDYTWYDYLGEHLASWGYVVISHRNDTQPGPVAAADTTLYATELFLQNQGGLGLTTLADPDRIGWIGHSRGGEGIVIAYDRLVSGDAGVTQFDAASVRVLQSIAPTNFEGPDGANPRDATFHILSGGADGDVTGGPDSGVTQYYRMFQRGTGHHYVTYVQGADHNDFNCCGEDDSQWFTVQGNPPVIGRMRAQQVAKAYLLALSESELRGEDAVADWLRALPDRLSPASVDATVALQTMPAADGDTLVLDDYQSNPTSDTSSLGGAVTSNAAFFGEGALDDANAQLAHNVSDPVNGMTWSANDADPARGAAIEWSTGDDVWIEWEIPAANRDWTGFRELSFRTCQATRNPQTVALNDRMSFSVALVDGAGRESAVDFGAYGSATRPYARAGLGAGVGWVNEFQTVRLALADFDAASPRIDRSDVVALRFRFGSAWGSPQGKAAFDDLELIR